MRQGGMLTRPPSPIPQPLFLTDKTLHHQLLPAPPTISSKEDDTAAYPENIRTSFITIQQVRQIGDRTHLAQPLSAHQTPSQYSTIKAHEVEKEQGISRTSMNQCRWSDLLQVCLNSIPCCHIPSAAFLPRACLV
jgi:hypothetical protein